MTPIMEEDLIIDNFSKIKLSNGNYNVDFTINGEPQKWVGVQQYQVDTYELFVAFVLKHIEFVDSIETPIIDLPTELEL